jgi:hypothetical protein
MQLRKETLIEAANSVSTFEELAEKIGWLKGVAEEKFDKVMERFIEQVSLVCPSIELLLDRTDAIRDLEQAKRSGNLEARKEAAERLQELTIQTIDAGLGMPILVGSPSRAGVPVLKKKPAKPTPPTPAPAPTVRDTKKKSADVPAVTKPAPTESPVQDVVVLKGKKRPSCSEEQAEELRKTLKSCTESIDSSAVRGDVLGMDPDGKYRARNRVMLFLRPGVFGAEVVVAPSVRQVTLHKGILNHCNIDEAPSPYWATLDAMSDLERFTKVEALERAVELHGKDRDKAAYPTTEKFMAACSIAYDVLKTHHVHPRKCYAGMSHMVVNCGSGPNKGKAEIRGRKSHETLEFYREHREKLEAARNTGAPMASVEQ